MSRGSSQLTSKFSSLDVPPTLLGDFLASSSNDQKVLFALNRRPKR